MRHVFGVPARAMFATKRQCLVSRALSDRYLNVICCWQPRGSGSCLMRCLNVAERYLLLAARRQCLVSRALSERCLNIICCWQPGGSIT